MAIMNIKFPDLAMSIRQFQEMQKKGKGRLGSHGDKSLKQSNRKEILKGITTYFNPGELVAIMGPSGILWNIIQ